MFVNKETT